MHKNSADEKTPSQEDVLALARERFDQAVDAEAEIRAEAIDDLEFRSGNQWPEDMRRARELDRRPCLTINRLPQFIRQITNDQRQNRPSMKVSPVDDRGDVETAKVIQGLLRHIEVNSNADVAYDTAFAGAVIHGFGFIRVTSDYCSDESFEQELLIKRVRNPFCVYLDPGYHEPDASDANWGFVFEDISKEIYDQKYPQSELASMEDWKSIGDNSPHWVTDKNVRVAEYFYKEFEDITLVSLSDGSVGPADQLPPVLPIGVTVESTRKAKRTIVKWLKINGVEVLEETVWPGKFIPIVPVLGDELDIDGKKILEGVIRHAKDPQRMYNFWASSETEAIALAPRAPFIGQKGQFEGFEGQWASANTKNHAYLEYNSKNGAPPPQRQAYEPAVQAITQARMQSADDLKATTGIYDASLGNRSNENSGIAIQRRNTQAQTNNFHYIDNLSRALRHVGRICIDAIPTIYDTARMLRTIGEEGEENIVAVNRLIEGKGEKAHWLGVGKYDVTVSSGPSFQTKRQEAVESMLSLTQSYPKVAEVAGDLMVKNMDWPGAQEIAERLKKSLPPGLAEDDKDKNTQIPPALKAQMDQALQMVEQLTQQLHAAHDVMDQKRLELESKERIEFKKLEVAVELKMAELGHKDGVFLMQQELAELARRQELVQMHVPIEQENEMAQGPDQSMSQPDQPPTGGFSPGQPVE